MGARLNAGGFDSVGATFVAFKIEMLIQTLQLNGARACSFFCFKTVKKRPHINGSFREWSPTCGPRVQITKSCSTVTTTRPLPAYNRIAYFRPSINKTRYNCQNIDYTAGWLQSVPKTIKPVYLTRTLGLLWPFIGLCSLWDQILSKYNYGLQCIFCLKSYFCYLSRRDTIVFTLSVCLSVCLWLKVNGQGRRSPKGQKRVFGHISETNSLRGSGLVSKCRGNLTFWSVTYSFQDRPGSKFGPPIENEKNRIFLNKCTTYIHGLCGLRDFAIPRTALVCKLQSFYVAERLNGW